jgi:acetyltransferase
MDGIKSFFEPCSVALVGATEREGSVGRILLDNLLLAKDQRKIYPINPKKETLLNIKSYPDINSLPETPDLLIVATAAKSVTNIIE